MQSCLLSFFYNNESFDLRVTDLLGRSHPWRRRGRHHVQAAVQSAQGRRRSQLVRLLDFPALRKKSSRRDRSL